MSAMVSASAILISFGDEAIGEKGSSQRCKDRKVGGAEINESDGFGPVHELIWRLSGCYDEESPKDLRKQNTENVLFVVDHGSVDRGHPFPNHHHFRSFVGCDEGVD